MPGHPGWSCINQHQAMQAIDEAMTDGWTGRALVVGAGGIGRALAQALPSALPRLEVVLCGRSLQPSEGWCVDLESTQSLDHLRTRLSDDPLPLRLVINATGLLHRSSGMGLSMQPEKRLQQVSVEALEASFSINAMAPLRLAQAVEPCLDRSLPFHFASLSARVGSIGDNRSGGWYAYRGAKAAQNMYLRCLSLEWGRRFPLATVLLLHPGTTDTALSKPFQGFVPAQSLFTPERAAQQLIQVLAAQGPNQSGSFLAWDGQSIPW